MKDRGGRIYPARLALACLVAAMFTSAPAAQQTFRGTITDATCAQTGHAAMRMGPTDAECARLCVTVHGAKFVLYDGTDVYELTDQRTPEEFAARKVKVVGTLDPAGKTIRVKSITAAD